MVVEASMAVAWRVSMILHTLISTLLGWLNHVFANEGSVLIRILIALNVEILWTINAMWWVIHWEAAHLAIEAALLIWGMDGSTPIVRWMRSFSLVVLLISLAGLSAYLDPQVLVLLLQHVQLDHVMLFQIVNFFVETLDLDILQLFLVLLCLLEPLFQVRHVFLEYVTLFLKITNYLVLFLAFSLQILTHFFKLSYRTI